MRRLTHGKPATSQNQETSLHETVKTEQAIRQELVKASVVLERAQTKMADQDTQADEFKKCYIQLEKQLNDSLDKIGKQDRYIALLLERQNAGQNISGKDQPKDEAGYLTALPIYGGST